MTNRDYKIHETLCVLNLFEMYYQLEDKYIDKSDDIQLWELNLPHYIFPHTHNTLDLIRKFQASYMPRQSAIVNPNGKILFTITP